MYTIGLINFGYKKPEEYNSLNDAIAAARKIGFDCVIYKGKEIVAIVSVFSGVSNIIDY